jgi:hypothetical protein
MKTKFSWIFNKEMSSWKQINFKNVARKNNDYVSQNLSLPYCLLILYFLYWFMRTVVPLLLLLHNFVTSSCI